MAFFDDLGKHLNMAVSDITAKTKEFTAVTKLNTSISSREREIEAAYAQIGKLLFEREAADPQSPATALCAKITANRESIEEMKAKILKIKEETKEQRKAKSDELFGAPESTDGAVSIDGETVSAESCGCGQSVEEAACACEKAAEDAVEAVEKACDCACDEAADVVEQVAEAAEHAADSLGDFYKKPEDKN